MKIHLLSDLHIEGYKFDINIYDVEADVLVLAGDIGRLDGNNFLNLRDFLQDCRKIYEHVIYVAGNHEFYFYEFFEAYRILTTLCEDLDIHFLQNEEVNIDGINFFGTTLWTDMNMMKYVKPVEQYLNDFRLIKVDGEIGKFTGQFVFDQNMLARKALEKTNANVIITHHIPLMEGVHPRWYGQLANYGFANTAIEPKGELWLYGHTHDSIEFHKDGTHFVCNPKGYGIENLNNFDPRKVVEI